MASSGKGPHDDEHHLGAFGRAGRQVDGTALAMTRLLRLADGPDEVHRNQIGKLEIRKYAGIDPALTGGAADVLTIDEARRMGADGAYPKPSTFGSDS